jgi:hypothetical protein
LEVASQEALGWTSELASSGGTLDWESELELSEEESGWESGPVSGPVYQSWVFLLEKGSVSECTHKLATAWEEAPGRELKLVSGPVYQSWVLLSEKGSVLECKHKLAMAWAQSLASLEAASQEASEEALGWTSELASSGGALGW